MRLLEKDARIQRRFRYWILTPPEDRPPVNLKAIYKCFSLIEIGEDDENERRIPTPAPSSLYTISRCVNYSEPRSRSEKGE